MDPKGRKGPYPWQIEFHNAGARHMERGVLAANQVGKCLLGSQQVLTPHGEVEAYRIRVGDMVMSWTGSRMVPARVLRVILQARRTIGASPCFVRTASQPRCQSPHVTESYRIEDGCSWKICSAAQCVDRIPTKLLPQMIRVAVEHLKVLDAVVQPVAVPVMHDLGGEEKPERPLHHEAMDGDITRLRRVRMLWHVLLQVAFQHLHASLPV